MALQGPAGPSAHHWLPALRYPPQDQLRRDSIKYILKLVINTECRLKSVMRPGILPVSKRGSNVTTLNFQDFHFAAPSLTRNKWSCFDCRATFIVKTAKCHQNVHQTGRGVVGYQLPHGSIPPTTTTGGGLLIDPAAGPQRGTRALQRALRNTEKY